MYKESKFLLHKFVQNFYLQAFSKIRKSFDKHCQKSEENNFFGILVIDHNLVGKTSVYKDYFFDYVLSEKMGTYYPQMKELDLLIIDLAPELENYRWAQIGPGRKYQIMYDKSFKQKIEFRKFNL